MDAMRSAAGRVLGSAAMSKPKLTYFDAPVSRGEECRLALHLAGIDFEDVRIKVADWPAMKDRMPYGSLPVLEWPGSPALAHSNAILVLMAVELMLNAVNISLVAFDAYWAEALRAGQSLTIFVITIAAAEIGLGLAILLMLYRMRRTIAVDEATDLREVVE